MWPVTWTSGNAVPQWIPVASGIVNLSTVPFGLPTAVTGSPQSLTVSLHAWATTSNKTHTAQLTTTISALDTPYNSNPTVTCSTAATQEGWT